MDKEKVFMNIFTMLNNGFFLEKYIKLTENISFTELSSEGTVNDLEEISSGIFNAILIGCQLFDEEEKIIKFVDMFSSYLDSQVLTMFLSEFDITEEDALERLKHGFGVHFTTTKICDEIQNKGCLIGFGKNAMFTKEEDRIIDQASKEQRNNDKEAEKNLNYLFRGWGTGVSFYSSITNGFWMYHTPESLSFLFGNISRRNKDEAMAHVSKNISALSEDNKRIVFDVMSNIYDRLIGNNQEIGCILIDRDAFEYEVIYHYIDGKTIAEERRPYSNSFNDLMSNDNKINNDIDSKYLKVLRLPTIYELEREKQQIMSKQGHNLQHR